MAAVGHVGDDGFFFLYAEDGLAALSAFMPPDQGQAKVLPPIPVQ